jgi:hypothetical protein
MTVAHLRPPPPLPLIPRPDPRRDLPPCNGLWPLFDSRRREDHWQARRICQRCPLKAGCKPPDKIVAPPMPGRPRGGSVASADGTWGGVLYHDGSPVDASLDLSDVEACPKCGATATEACRSKTGHTIANHKARTMPRMCARCGAVAAAAKSVYCQPCRAANDQDAKNAYLRRRAAQGAA